jgi:hypothetical protein
MVKLPNTTDSDEKGKSLWGWILVNGDRVWNFQKKQVAFGKVSHSWSY